MASKRKGEKDMSASYLSSKPEKDSRYGNLTVEKEIKRWQERISIAKESSDLWAQESGAKRFIDYYHGKFDLVFHGRVRKIPVPPINEVFAYVQTDISQTYNRDPYITVNPRSGTVLGAKLWEVVLNYEWRELKIKEEIEPEIIDKDLVGFGWHKTGYATQSIGTNELLKIENERCYSKRVQWRDIVWDSYSKTPPYDCRWMAHRIVLPIEELKERYPRASKMQGSQRDDIDKSLISGYDRLTFKDDLQVGVMWEIWDASKKKIYLIGEGFDTDYLIDPKGWPDYLDEFPFHMYWDLLSSDKSRPMSAISPWEPQLLEEMILLAQAVNHSKRWNRQLFMKGAQLDDVTLDKFERGDDGAILPVNSSLNDENFRFVDFGALPTDFYLLMDRLQAIRRNIHGQPEFSRGGTTKTQSRTIGELQLMNEGVKSREERKIDRLETHCENIARHLLAHLKANFDFTRTVKITGNTPEEVIQALGDHYDPMTGTVTFDEDDIKGEYDVEVKAGSTLPLDKRTRMSVYETVLQSVAQVATQAPMSPFLNALIQELLKDYDIKSLQEAYKLEQEMAQQRAQEAQGQQSIEDQKTQAEAMKRMAQAENVSADTELVRTENEILMQDSDYGSIGRSLLKQIEKPKTPKAPKTNGSSNGAAR